MLREELGPKGPVTLLLGQVERMEQIVADFHRLSTDQPSAKERVSLSERVREAQRQFSLNPESARLTLEVDAPGRVDVLGNARLLEQLVLNLLCNARDAMNGLGRVKVVVTTVAGVPALYVADWGPGVPPELRDRIFEPYVTSKSRGSGLGLAVCRRIVADHRAVIDLAPSSLVGESPPPATVFRVLFPSGTQAEPAPRPRILIVDDESIIRMVFRDLMGKECEVVEAETAEEGLLLLKNSGFDLIVTDKNLPGLSGLDLALEARKINPRSKVLLMTGYPSLITAQQAIELGVMEYLLKPFDDIREVRDRIRAALAAPAPGVFHAINKRVDIYEDNPATSRQLVEAIRTLGMEPNLLTEAKPGGEEPPAGVVVSWDFNPAPGHKAIELARAVSRGAPFVVLAEHLTMDNALESLRAGATACLPKLLGDVRALSRELARALKLST